MAKHAFPRVCLVGRTNVGKSAIFNRLTRKSIQNLVLDQENVTRDYLEGLVRHEEKAFTLIDTGGFCFKQIHDTPLAEEVNAKVRNQIVSSDVLLFVCDAMTGPIEEDLLFLSEMRKTYKKHVLLVINKADNPVLMMHSKEFAALGFPDEDTFAITATHGKGFPELRDKIYEVLPEQKCISVDRPEYGYKVAIIGKPNVGKSSLLNQLIKQDRSIVSDVEGTTREAVSCLAHIDQTLFELVDTAGVRRKKTVAEGLEGMMVKSSLEAVRTATLILLVVDSTEKKLCKQDLRLLSYAGEKNKNLMLILNKTDLLQDFDKLQLDHELELYDFLLKKVPVVRISCVDQRGIGRVKKHIQALKGRSEATLNSEKVSEALRTYLNHRPLYKKQQILKIFKIKCIESRIPTFHLYVNKPELFGNSELSCVENVIRKEFDMLGCPMRFETKQA